MEFIITSNFHNVRLDKFLCKTYQEIPMAGIFKMIRKGNVKVNKKKKKQNFRLQEGDIVRVWEATPPTAAKTLTQLSATEKEFIANCIIYQDKNVLLCNKPQGMVMHAGSSHHHGLTELVLSYTQNRDFTFVHRIDKMTSGLVLGSKNLPTTRQLSQFIRDRNIEKTYVILVEGIIQEKQFTLNTFLKTEEDCVRSYADNKNGAKKAESSFVKVLNSETRTLLKATLHTGRKHQLRVQLADIGHAIVGDRKYGQKSNESQMFLFSQSLKLPAMDIDFSLPIPESFYSALTSE